MYDWHWRCCAFGDTSCGFIDSTFALSLKIHLRFRGSFLRFHIMAVFIAVCLLATLRKNFQTALHVIFREGWQWASEQTVKFWWRSGSPSGWIHGLFFSGFITIGRHVKWLRDINLLLHPVIYSYRFARWRDWYRDTGKTCLGGGMHCPSASSNLFIYYARWQT